MPALTNLESVFSRVQKPARYTGGEWNSIVKDWDACDVRVALAYPDLYDIGMSNLGLGILYDIVNKRDGMLAERVFSPWSDLEPIMRAEGIPLWSLETRHPIGEFDMIGISLSYEGTYTNILNLLDLAGLPVLAAERTDAHPLVLCGGSGALNPDALADFVDVFALGEVDVEKVIGHGQTTRGPAKDVFVEAHAGSEDVDVVGGGHRDEGGAVGAGAVVGGVADAADERFESGGGVQGEVAGVFAGDEEGVG